MSAVSVAALQAGFTAYTAGLTVVLQARVLHLLALRSLGANKDTR